MLKVVLDGRREGIDIEKPDFNVDDALSNAPDTFITPPKEEELVELLTHPELGVALTRKYSPTANSFIGKAVTNGNYNIVKCTLKRGGSQINLNDEIWQGTPLQIAVEDRKGAEMVDLLIQNGASVDPDILCQVVVSGDVDTIKVLLRAGADIEATSTLGKTLLTEAANCRNPKMVQLLIEAGANICAKNEYGMTALHLAVRSGGEIHGRIDAICQLLVPGAPIDETDSYGRTPLFWAAVDQRNDPIALLLVSRGADRHAKNQLGETPLELAERNGVCHSIVMWCKDPILSGGIQ
ncbi:hypothetical protein OQA88_7946 [Cercophora sp. LCS_1]